MRASSSTDHSSPAPTRAGHRWAMEIGPLAAIVALLEHARNMYRAERAEILLYPRSAAGDALLTTTAEDMPAATMIPVVIALDDPIQRRVQTEARAFFHVPSLLENGETRIRQAMVAPLRGEAGTIGSILIGNRLTQGTISQRFAPG